MKIQNLNLGKSLSRDEQKQIKGGGPSCPDGVYCSCKNSAGVVTKYPGEGGGICTNYCYPLCKSLGDTLVACGCNP